MNSIKGRRIGCLDGLRGLAALWVIVGHAHILTGFRFPVVGDPDLGVDLFIMLSGFLMVFQYRLREDREPWQSPDTWRSFWARRFFRIAPLYYIMLIIALASGPAVYESRMVIDTFNHVTPQVDSRYLDSSFANYLAHLTFVFGLLPEYAYSTPLPDWSIGLEMQFYVAFPFLMILIAQVGWLAGSLAIVVASIATVLVVHHFGVDFPMPTFLPLKMHVFIAGMLLAGALHASRRVAFSAFMLAIILVLIPYGGATGRMHEAVRVGIVVLFFSLVHVELLPGAVARVARPVSQFLGNSFCNQLGELSFGAYLIHLLIMQPVIALLIKNYSMSDPVRWVVSLVITIPMVYLLSWLGYRFVEVPGQKIGKMLSTRPSREGVKS